MAEQADMPFLDLEQTPPQQEAVQKLDTATARAFSVLPVSAENGVLTVAFADPLNASVLSDIAFTTGLEIKGAIADQKQIEEGLERYYKQEAAQAKQQMKDLVADLSREGTKLDLEDKAAMASAAPVVKLLNYILYQAIRDIYLV